MRATRFAVLGMVLTCAAASVAPAQAPARPLASLGISAGQSSATGATRDIYAGGAHAAAIVELRTALPWLSVRLEGGYQRLGSRTFGVTNRLGDQQVEGQTTTGMITGSAGVALRVPGMNSRVRPYLLAGVGSYWVRSSVVVPAFGDNPSFDQTGSLRVNGMHAGFGFEVPIARTELFGEARYQRVGEAPLNFVPLSLGVRIK